jgi:hypothetical protein
MKHRLIDTKDNINTQKLDRAPPKYRGTRALLCCACMFIVLTTACTHDPQTEFYPALIEANKHPTPAQSLSPLAAKTNPQEGIRDGNKTKKRTENRTETPIISRIRPR